MDIFVWSLAEGVPLRVHVLKALLGAVSPSGLGAGLLTITMQVFNVYYSIVILFPQWLPCHIIMDVSIGHVSTALLSDNDVGQYSAL